MSERTSAPQDIKEGMQLIRNACHLQSRRLPLVALVCHSSKSSLKKCKLSTDKSAAETCHNVKHLYLLFILPFKMLFVEKLWKNRDIAENWNKAGLVQTLEKGRNKSNLAIQ